MARPYSLLISARVTTVESLLSTFSLTGQKLLTALESGNVFHDIFNSPPTKFTTTNHLASTITQISVIENGRWKTVKDGLSF
jgi:hypothetical protein